MKTITPLQIENDTYCLNIACLDGQVWVRLQDRIAAHMWVDGAYTYRAALAKPEGRMLFDRLVDARVKQEEERLVVTGKLAGLNIRHVFHLPIGRRFLEEQISLHNDTTDPIALADLLCGLPVKVADVIGRISPERQPDQIVALPFRHRADDPPDVERVYSIQNLLTQRAWEHYADRRIDLKGYVPSDRWFSEAWAWMHADFTLGIFKFNPTAMEFSTLSIGIDEMSGGGGAISARLGGVGMIAGEPSALAQIEPGQQIEMGVTRFVTMSGTDHPMAYAYRSFLDEKGCRFPPDYDPPVHWNELYDNPEWGVGTPGNPPGKRLTRAVTYTRALILEEAAKARDYHCESLYLDPGWDTDFGTLLWGQEWLGDQQSFIRILGEEYGLKLSLHCPLATWLSYDARGVATWPKEAERIDADGQRIPGFLCLGSRQYLDEAAKRLIDHAAAGVAFLMFDGNAWGGGCWNPDHGHPTPYTLEDHACASLTLAQRIHRAYPRVLIEMHDPIASGVNTRFCPVYYKYPFPGSFDENWGFELMWQPMEDLRFGRARALYFYNLSCNIPMYLHVDLRGDNEHCLVLWWYASTCRHLGIGGTHPNPRIAAAQKEAMLRYRQLDRYFKRGEFYGVHEEMHVHALPGENAFVVTLFNLSDQSRLISGEIQFAEIGLDAHRWYTCPYSIAEAHFNPTQGTLFLQRRLPAWGAEVIEIRPVD